MNAEILSISNELLYGDVVNDNAQYLSVQMENMGINTICHTSIPYKMKLMEKALNDVKTRSNIVFITCDIYKPDYRNIIETLSRIFGVRTVPYTGGYSEMEQKPDNINELKNIKYPANSVLFHDNNSNILGFAFQSGRQIIIMLPNTHNELVYIFENHVSSYLNKFSVDSVKSHTVRIFGVSIKKARSVLKDYIIKENPMVRIFSDNGECVIKITATADNQDHANHMMAPIIAEIKKRFGRTIYGVDVNNLQEVVVDLLKRKSMTVSTAESCTAGLVSKRITEIPGSSDVFTCGITAYANEIKTSILGVKADTIEKYGAVSPEVAAAMAIGVRRVSGTALGIGITGIAGPGGGTIEKPVGLVYVALADSGRVWVKKLRAAQGREREYIRSLAASNALDLVRRYLDGLPDLPAGAISLNSYKTNRDFLDAITPEFENNKKKSNIDEDGIEKVIVVDENFNNPKMMKSSKKWLLWVLLIIVLLAVTLAILWFTPLNPFGNADIASNPGSNPAVINNLSQLSDLFNFIL